MVENFDQAQFAKAQRSVALVLIQSLIPADSIVAEQAAYQAGKIAGNVFCTSRGGVDQACQFIAGKQQVVVPDISQTRMQANLEIADGAQFFGDSVSAPANASNDATR